MWILLLIQMNNSVADLHYVELYQTKQECLHDMEEISPRLEGHEVMICMEANMQKNTPGGGAEGQLPRRRADGSGDSGGSNVVQAGTSVVQM